MIISINGYDVHEVDGTKGQWVMLIDPSKIQHAFKEKKAKAIESHMMVETHHVAF